MPITHAAHANPITATDYEADHEGVDDTIPSGGTLYDGTTTSGWTSFESPTTFDADSTVPGAFYLAKTSIGANNLVGAYRSVGGSFPRTYTMRVKDALCHRNYQGCNLLIGESGGAGKYQTWGITAEQPSRFAQRYAWTTPTSSGANTNYSGNIDRISVASWWRIVVNSSTDIEFWHSWNGYIWHQFASAINPGFTIAIFGFGIFAFGTIPGAVAVDWIHES